VCVQLIGTGTDMQKKNIFPLVVLKIVSSIELFSWVSLNEFETVVTWEPQYVHKVLAWNVNFPPLTEYNTHLQSSWLLSWFIWHRYAHSKPQLCRYRENTRAHRSCVEMESEHFYQRIFTHLCTQFNLIKTLQSPASWATSCTHTRRTIDGIFVRMKLMSWQR